MRPSYIKSFIKLVRNTITKYFIIKQRCDIFKLFFFLCPLDKIDVNRNNFPINFKNEQTLGDGPVSSKLLTVNHKVFVIAVMHPGSYHPPCLKQTRAAETCCCWVLLPGCGHMLPLVFLSSVPSYSASSQTTN